MEIKSFAYWLQGFFELSDAKTLTEEQVRIIRNHLNMVFIHDIDPAMGDEAHRDELTKAHEGESSPEVDADKKAALEANEEGSRVFK